MLPCDKRRTWLEWTPWMWGTCCWLRWQRGWHPVGDVSRHSNWAKRRSGSCSFIWLNRSSRMVVRKVGKRTEASAEVKLQQQTRYGPDWGAPPSSACVLSEPHYSGLKRPSLPAFQKTTEDGQAAGRQINQKKKQTESYNFSTVGKTKAKTFCLHASTRARPLINPRCWCLGGVKSEGSCPLWPRGSTELYWVDDWRDLTALSPRIRRYIYSVSWKSSLFHRILMAHDDDVGLWSSLESQSL